MKKPVDLGRLDPRCTGRWHGTESAYTKGGCRCSHAREARRLVCKRRREHRHAPRNVDATGTARRIRALVAIGWSYDQIGQRLGCAWRNVQRLALQKRPTVEQRTARRVARLYRELSVRPGPSQRARSIADRKGWYSPIFWDRIDDPNEHPDCGRGPATDHLHAFRQLRAAGTTRRGICNQLRISGRTYGRLLARTAGDGNEAVAA